MNCCQQKNLKLKILRDYYNYYSLKIYLKNELLNYKYFKCKYNWVFCKYPDFLGKDVLKLLPIDAPDVSNINESLGLKKANLLAKALNFPKKTILTKKQFNCLLLKSPSSIIIISCILNLTNTCDRVKYYNESGFLEFINKNDFKDFLNVRNLSSYGLSIFKINNKFYISSSCSTNNNERNCLKFNKLLVGSIEETAFECKELLKLLKILTFTFKEILDGANCQDTAGNPCLAYKSCSKYKYRKYYGVPVTPDIWITNFILLYFLSPSLAAAMPKYTQQLPIKMAKKLLKEDYISYKKYTKYFIDCN
jgi:hypothetical protein